MVFIWLAVPFRKQVNVCDGSSNMHTNPGEQAHSRRDSFQLVVLIIVAKSTQRAADERTYVTKLTIQGI